MKCRRCKSKAIKNGKRYNGTQRWACKECGHYFSSSARSFSFDNRRKMPDKNGERWCLDCEKYKPYSEFHKKRKSGYASYCKPCMSDRGRYDKYGITKKEFTALSISQDNKCAICKEEFIITPRVDHDHKTGDIRGLLCDPCNQGIGMLKDDPEILMNAIKYLT